MKPTTLNLNLLAAYQQGLMKSVLGIGVGSLIPRLLVDGSLSTRLRRRSRSGWSSFDRTTFFGEFNEIYSSPSCRTHVNWMQAHSSANIYCF